MRLSESLRRNIIHTTVGGIINTFKGKSRRTTLFFEDILANYIKMCEAAGYGNKMEKIGERWAALATKQFSVPEIFRNTTVLNYVANTVWLNIGLMDSVRIEKLNSVATIETKNEFITRVVGKNEFMAGFFAGCLNAYFGKKTKISNSNVELLSAHYYFKIIDEQYNIAAKDKNMYNRMNEIKRIAGHSLKSAIGSHIITLKENRAYFRDKCVMPVENTVFHIIGNEGILLENVPSIAYEFFKGIVDTDSTSEKKLALLKNLLQIMGWCTANIAYEKNKITMRLNNLPIGLQIEKDNWKFLTQTILGYLWIINKAFQVENISQTERRLTIVFNSPSMSA